MLKGIGLPVNRDGVRAFFSLQNVFTTRNIILMGLMLAIGAVLSRFSIYITPTFKAVSFAYLPGTVVACLMGPWAALAYGFINDFIAYIVNPQGPYFPFYAISEMTAYFIYACLMYRQRVTYLRALIARALILIVVVFGLNYVWTMMMYGTAASAYFTGVRFINNLGQMPFHALLITLVIRQLGMIKALPAAGKRGE